MAGRASIIDDYDGIKKAKEDLFPNTASSHKDAPKALPYKELVSVYLDAEFEIVQVGGLNREDAKGGVFITKNRELFIYRDGGWCKAVYKEHK